MPDRAIGLLHLSRTTQEAKDRTLIERLATQHGYELVRILTIDDTTFMATAFILGAATDARAAVIIMPDLDHLGPGRRAVPDTCPVLVPACPVPKSNPSTTPAAAASTGRV